jgi:RNA polymerase sigma-70 factor (ECF subfamily)
MSIACTQVLPETIRSATSPRTGTAPTDQALIERVAKGDQAALRALANRHYGRILRFVLRFIADRELAEEAVNETLFAVWRQAPHFEKRSAVATWMLGIARYKALAARKRGRLALVALEETNAAEFVDPAERPDMRVESADSRQYLKRCVRALPVDQAAVIELVYYRGKSVKDAAEIVGVPVNTVKTRMFLARKKLAAMLALEADGGPCEHAGRALALQT